MGMECFMILAPNESAWDTVMREPYMRLVVGPLLGLEVGILSGKQREYLGYYASTSYLTDNLEQPSHFYKHYSLT